MLRQRKTRRTATYVALGLAIVGLIFAAYAANPDGTVTISAVGNDGKHVWGKGETVSYKAQCGVCNATDYTGFTQTAGLTATSNYNNDSFAYVSGVKDTTGTYDLAAECPEDNSHGAPTQQFKVVDLVHLKIDGNSVEGTVPCIAQATGNVTLTAELTPAATASELRSNFMGWTKTAGDLSFTKTDELTVTVSKTTAGWITLQAKAGNNGTQQSVTIYVVGVKRVEISQNSTWTQVDGGDDEVILKGTIYTFRAIKDPEDAPAWPSGTPTWDSSYWGTNRSDNGDQTTVTFTGQYDDRYVTATCGSSSKTATLDVIVPQFDYLKFISGESAVAHDISDKSEEWKKARTGQTSVNDPSLVFHSDDILSKQARARRTFSRMSAAFAVQVRDRGFSLCAAT